MRTLLCICCALASAHASAQTTQWVSPKAAATSGNSNNNIPYSWYPARYQQIYDFDSFAPAMSGPAIIKSVNYRMNASFTNRPGQTIDVSMWLGYASSGTSSASFNTTFDSNIDATTKKAVIARRKISLPQLNNTNFDVKFPFDSSTNFIYLATRKVSLVKEVIVWGNSNNSSIFTYPLDAASGTTGTGSARLYAYQGSPGAGSYVQNGSYAGCNNSNSVLVNQYASATNIKVGNSTGYAYAYGRIASLPCVGILGSAPLNVTLPGTSCNLMQNVTLLFPGAGDTSTLGRWQFNFAVPNDASLGNVKFYWQTVFVNPGANALGLVSTRGIQITIGDGIGTTPDKYTTATGSTKTYGLVTQFQQ